MDNLLEKLSVLQSVYSDGTEEFVSPQSPHIGDTVTIWLRMLPEAPVRRVFLRTIPNGEEELREMVQEGIQRSLLYYRVSIRMSERRLNYQFYLVTDAGVYYYNQRGVFPYIPDQRADFVLLADYVQPAWVKRSVFYQIFPERFCNGDDTLTVQTGEYSLDGHPSLRIENWEQTPGDYAETFCLDFYGGDLDGIRQKIPYLQRLGVTALYLNPIFYAPTVHKYDCIDYEHVDPHLGGDEALARLSEALHQAGMHLILDISINHTGAEHRWFNKAGSFYPTTLGGYHNPNAPERQYYFFSGLHDYRAWFHVDNLPELNYSSQALREAIYAGENAVLKKWLRAPYAIDGWRFDVADTVGRSDEVQVADVLWPAIRRAVRSVNPQAYILGEDWDDCAAHLQGTEWDSPMNYYGCARIIRQFVGEQDLLLQRHDALRDLPVHMPAEYVKARLLDHFASLPWVLQENQFNLLDSHDVTRLHTNPQIHPECIRGAVMFLFALPGAASIYYGDEVGIDGLPGTNEGCRYPMPWSKIDEQSEPFTLYQTLCQLKASHRALSEGGMKILYAHGPVLSIARFTRYEVFVFVMSVSDQYETAQLPLAYLGAERPAADTDVFARSLLYTSYDKGITLSLPPRSAYFFPCSMRI